jgi:hypothetical protein
MKRWHNWHIFRQGSDTPVLTVRARHVTGALQEDTAGAYGYLFGAAGKAVKTMPI